MQGRWRRGPRAAGSAPAGLRGHAGRLRQRVQHRRPRDHGRRLRPQVCHHRVRVRFHRQHRLPAWPGARGWWKSPFATAGRPASATQSNTCVRLISSNRCASERTARSCHQRWVVRPGMLSRRAPCGCAAMIAAPWSRAVSIAPHRARPRGPRTGPARPPRRAPPAVGRRRPTSAPVPAAPADRAAAGHVRPARRISARYCAWTAAVTIPPSRTTWSVMHSTSNPARP